MITFETKSQLGGEFLLRHNINKFLMHTLGNLSLFTNFNLGSKISTLVIGMDSSFVGDCLFR